VWAGVDGFFGCKPCARDPTMPGESPWQQLARSGPTRVPGPPVSASLWKRSLGLACACRVGLLWRCCSRRESQAYTVPASMSSPSSASGNIPPESVRALPDPAGLRARTPAHDGAWPQSPPRPPPRSGRSSPSPPPMPIPRQLHQGMHTLLLPRMVLVHAPDGSMRERGVSVKVSVKVSVCVRWWVV